jgi:GTPase
LRDISHAERDAQSQDVEAVLDEIGVADHADRVIEVCNKVDLLDADARAALAREQGTNEPSPLGVSAATAEGIEHLLTAIEDRLARGRSQLELTLDLSDGQGLHWLYEHAEVMSRRDEADGLRLTVRVTPDQIERVKRRFAMGPARVPSSHGRPAGA